MTINVQVPVNRHVASGQNTDFPYTFYAPFNSYVRVVLNGAEQTEGADYDLIDITPAGGTVRFYTPPFLNSAIVIYRRTPVDQTTDYDPYDPFPAETHERALDKLTMIAQENRARAATALPLHVSGLYWDAQGLRIQNGADPLDADHYATKRYVDQLLGPLVPTDWDPEADWDTSGNWNNSGNWDFTGDLTYNGDQVATVDQIPDISGKADKIIEIQSGDTDEITITDPTLADNVVINARTNLPNALTKLNASGKVPNDLLPFTSLEFLGGYDPVDGYPGAGTPGQFYIFTAAGSLPLLDRDGDLVLTDVSAGDWTIYSNDPVAGWYYIQRTIEAIPASFVTYDNTQVPAGRQLSAEDVQAAIDEIANEFANRTRAETVSGLWNFSGARPTWQSVGLATLDELPDVSDFPRRDINEVITGQWEFASVIRIVGSAWPAGVGLNGQVLTTDGAGQLSWEEGGGGGGGMDPTQDYTISGDWNFIGGFTKNGDEVAALTDLAPYTQRAANEVITGAWNFSNGLTTDDILSSGGLDLNGNPTNTSGGLAQVGGTGKLPISIMPFSALTFQGTWDASGGTNPPAGDGGDFYVINVGGTLDLIDPDTGLPVATPVEPGDYIVWVEQGTPGWYHVRREAPAFVDAAFVTYDPTGSIWTETILQNVLDEISVVVDAIEDFDPDADYTITGSWNFTASLLRAQILDLNGGIFFRNGAFNFYNVDDGNSTPLRFVERSGGNSGAQILAEEYTEWRDVGGVGSPQFLIRDLPDPVVPPADSTLYCAAAADGVLNIQAGVNFPTPGRCFRVKVAPGTAVPKCVVTIVGGGLMTEYNGSGDNDPEYIQSIEITNRGIVEFYMDTSSSVVEFWGVGYTVLSTFPVPP